MHRASKAAVHVAVSTRQSEKSTVFLDKGKTMSHRNSTHLLIMVAAALAYLALVILAAPAAHATVYTWDNGGGGGGGAWGTTTNWSPDVVPTSADWARFTDYQAATAIGLGGVKQTVSAASFENAGGTGYTLQTATWNDGSRAVLDSRGMLHLRSSDSAIPELTLVRCGGALAGWCADGRWFGPAYFIGEHTATSGAAIYDEVLRPFLARLR